MCGKFLLLAIVLCDLTIVITGFDVDTILAQHKNSLKALRRNDRSVDIQKGQEACFDWYFQAIEDNVNIYRNNTAKCVTEAKDAVKALNAQGADTRQGFVNTTRDVCRNFEQCEDVSDLLNFYHCYSEVSAASTPLIYRLSANSSAEFDSLRIKYVNVDADQQNCEKSAREEYLADSEVTDKQFESCRAGNGVPNMNNKIQRPLLK